MPALDETDVELLQLLSHDARRTITDIADAVGLSGAAVADRSPPCTRRRGVSS